MSKTYTIESGKLDIEDVINIMSHYLTIYIENKKPLVYLGHNYNIDLSSVTLCTMPGSLALATYISRIITSGVSVGVILPNNRNACGYLKSAGLYDLLNIPVKSRSVSLINMVEGKPSFYGKKVFHSKPIYSLDDANQFIKMSNIVDWTKNLDREIRESEFFQNGRFSRIVSAELSHNIISHASLPKANMHGRDSFGAIGMRIIKKRNRSDIKWIYESFDNHYHNFIVNHMNNGFVEAFICDPGDGLYDNLISNYLIKLCELKNSNVCESRDENIKDVLQFAFDEFGTSKSKHDQWVTDAHALSRILGLVNVYGGILELYTSGYKLVYNMYNSTLDRCDNHLGYKATSGGKIDIPFGTFIRILSPLTRTKTIPASFVGQLSDLNIHNQKQKKISIISVANEYNSKMLELPLEFKKRTELICLKHIEINRNAIIVFDFSLCDYWKSDHIATMLDMISNVALRNTIVIVGINSWIVTEIKDRVYESIINYNLVLVSDGVTKDISDEMPNKFMSNIVDYYIPVLSIDLEGGINWLGAVNECINKCLCTLLNKSLTIEALLKLKPISDIYEAGDYNILLNTLKSLKGFLFDGRSVGVGKSVEWFTLFDRETIKLIANKPLITHLKRHLNQQDGALWGKSDDSIYLLPHSKRYVKTFIEAYRLLQNDILCEEIGEVLARKLWIAMDREEPNILITTTAPSVLLAYSMRKWFKGSPLILDVGHYFDSTKKNTLKSLAVSSEQVSVTIIQDIMNTGKHITDIYDTLLEYNISVSSVCCIIELTDTLDINAGDITLREFGSSKTKLNFVSLFKVPSSREATASEIKKGKLFWIEPYSLHPYELNKLRSSEHEYLNAGKSLAHRQHNVVLSLLEKENILRDGHFVYEEHHFSIVTKMMSLFEESSLADQIAVDIADTCDTSVAETIILVPLHSHIRYLIPKIVDILSSRHLNISTMFAIVTKELGQKPYYMMPPKLKTLMQQRINDLQSGKQLEVLNILIVDDTTASLRTFETMLRALYISCGKCKNYSDSLLKDLINRIDIWAVINRAGRAKSTYLYSMQSWIGVPFEFHCYAEYDMPVYDSQHCPICIELADMERIKNILKHTVSNSLQSWVENRIQELQPIIVDSPTFEQLDQRRFPNNCKFTVFDMHATTVSLALLLFYEIAERGCPPRYLIDYIYQFTNNNSTHLFDVNVIIFRKHIYRWLIANTKKIAADASMDLFYKHITIELTIRPYMAMDIAETVASQFNKDKISQQILIKIVELHFKIFNDISVICLNDTSSVNMIKREYLFNAILLCRAVFISYNRHMHLIDNIFNKSIDKLTDRLSFPGDFLGSIKETLRTAIAFTSNSEPEYIECLKYVSMELLGSSLKDPKYEVKHSNRIYKHLSELSRNNKSYNDINYLTSKLASTSCFLELRSNILIEAISKILSHRLKHNADYIDTITNISTNFDTLIDKLQRYTDKDINEYSEIKVIASNIIKKLYTDTSIIFNAVNDINVGYVDMLNAVRKISEIRGVHSRLELPSLQNTHTVFADYIELFNLIKNHSVDVLEDNNKATIKITVEECSETERINIIITTYDPTNNSYKKITEGHGMRYERWGLSKYDIRLNLDYDEANASTIKMRCSMLRGYK